MKAISKIIKIPNNSCITTEYIEEELFKRNINPLRWAIVEIESEYLILSVAGMEG